MKWGGRGSNPRPLDYRFTMRGTTRHVSIMFNCNQIGRFDGLNAAKRIRLRIIRRNDLMTGR